MSLIVLLFPPLALAGVDVGSYGRVQISADPDGGQGDAVNVVAHGTRLEKDPYLEVDLAIDQTTDSGATFEVVLTPALQGDLFHYDGQWDADLAVRNLYVEARDFSPAPVAVWAGSRMFRGDDVYLLDLWPLDDVNTVGGGLRWEPEAWRVGAHVGLNRLVGEDWQVQLRDLPVPGGVGTEEVLVVDRQRVVATVQGARLVELDGATLRFKAYAELQALPAATRLKEDFFEEPLPADLGSVIGVQASAWGWANDSYVHLWYRHATGLGAFDDLAIPWAGVATDLRAAKAREHLVAVAGNHEGSRAGVMVGGYLRRFADADNIDVDVDDRWEGVLAVRPGLFVGQHGYLGVELSHQWLRPDGLNPRTGTHDVPQVTKLAVLPALQLRPGGLARPQLRLQYIASLLNDDARLWYAPEDSRHRANVQHFVGLGAEWWLNSKSYR